MGCLAQGFDENTEGIRASEIVELRFLEAIGGVEWGRMESDVAEAEQLALLKIEQEEAFHSGRPFGKQEGRESTVMVLAARFIYARSDNS